MFENVEFKLCDTLDDKMFENVSHVYVHVYPSGRVEESSVISARIVLPACLPRRLILRDSTLFF